MARRRIPLALAAAVLALTGLAGTAAAEDRSSQPGEAAPGTDCHVIDFESARVHTSPTVPARRTLVVRGEKPYLNMEVTLVPLVYVQQPEYWGIGVIGCLPEVGLPAVGNYVAKLDLTGSMGTRGIEVIGANHSKKINLRDNQHWSQDAR
ncbi:MAG: hypothetical protein ACREB3_13510 [Burkholderiales bacterium]